MWHGSVRQTVHVQAAAKGKARSPMVERSVYVRRTLSGGHRRENTYIPYTNKSYAESDCFGSCHSAAKWKTSEHKSVWLCCPLHRRCWLRSGIQWRLQQTRTIRKSCCTMHWIKRPTRLMLCGFSFMTLDIVAQLLSRFPCQLLLSMYSNVLVYSMLH